MRSDNMLLLHGNNRYHAKEREYQGTDIVAKNTYRAELGLKVYGKSTQKTTQGNQLIDFSELRGKAKVVITNEGYNIVLSSTVENAGSNSNRVYRTVESKLSDVVIGKFITASVKDWKSDVPYEKYIIGLRYTVDGGSKFVYLSKLSKVKIPSYVTEVYIRLFFIESANNTVPIGTYTVKFEGVMVNLGETLLEWEPYTGGIPSPNPDYPQPINSIGDSGSVDVVVSDNNGNSQTLTINTPNGLCGIPVDTGGNYTDSTGQQLVCDEVDFERGVYVQRIGKITSYNNEQLSTKYMSTTGKLTTGASVIYILAAPIETPLTAEELAAYKAIKSYPHYTRIESAAEMTVKLKEY